MAALASLLLTMFAAAADAGIGKGQDSAQRFAVQGPGPTSRTSETGNVAPCGGKYLWDPGAARKSGTRQSLTAILDGLRVDAIARLVFRIRRFESRSLPDFAAVRPVAGRAPPAAFLAF
jgi:hypothetical protein